MLMILLIKFVEFSLCTHFLMICNGLQGQATTKLGLIVSWFHLARATLYCMPVGCMYWEIQWRMLIKSKKFRGTLFHGVELSKPSLSLLVWNASSNSKFIIVGSIEEVHISQATGLHMKNNRIIMIACAIPLLQSLLLDYVSSST